MSKILLVFTCIILTIQVQAQQLASIADIKEDGRWVEIKADVDLSPESFLSSHKYELGLAEVDQFVLADMEVDDLGQSHHKFDQMTNGVKVEGAQYIVHEQNGRILRSNGRLVGDIVAPDEALITAEEAIDAAILYTDAKQYYWEIAEKEEVLKRITQDDKATFYPNPELVYADREYGQDGSQYRLAWKMEIHAMGPKGEKIIFIDARDGHILFELEGCNEVSVEGVCETRYHGTQTFMTDSLAPGVYRLHDDSRGVSIETYNMQTLPADSVPDGAVDFLDSDNYWDEDNAEADNGAYDVHWGIQHTYDFFLSQGRNSYDGNGSPIISYVHVRRNWFNARWTGRWMEYGDGNGNPLTSIDVVAHELTHGVTGTSAGLVYRNESGALNESFSDIFGTMVEHVALPDSADWFIGKRDFQFRSVEDPHSFQDPDTYFDQFWITGDEDNGGVHTNSSVQNYWFYLLSVGGSGVNANDDSYDVQPIGMEKAAAIAFRNLTTYLTVSSTYADARYGAILSAEDLYGPCSPEVQQVAHAWYAVGVGPDMVINDLELVGPTSPTSSSCEFSNEEVVTIDLLYRRSGCQNEIPIGTKLPVSYSINDEAPVLDTITLTEALIDGNSLSYTFVAPVDLSEPDYYDFEFTATFPGDQNAENDVIQNFTVVSVETLTDYKLIHFNEFVRPQVPPYFLIANANSEIKTARDAAATGLRGMEMRGKNVNRNNIDYPDTPEEVFTNNPNYETRLCMCVDATNADTVSVEFDLYQEFSLMYARFAPEIDNPNMGVGMRLIADEMPVSQHFYPDTFVNDTIDIDTFVHHRVNLDHLAGTAFNLCFQGKHFFSRTDDFLDSEGDFTHIDNVELFMNNFVGTRNQNLDPSLVLIFPNPVSDQLTVQWNVDFQAQALMMRNVSGQLVHQVDGQLNDQLNINVSNMPNGIYFIEIRSADGVVVKKVLVQ